MQCIVVFNLLLFLNINIQFNHLNIPQLCHRISDSEKFPNVAMYVAQFQPWL